MKNKILKIAKMLKTFTMEDLVMMSDLEVNDISKEIQELLKDKIITKSSKYYEYVSIQKQDNIKIINKNIGCKNSDITVIEACEEFLKIKRQTLTLMSYQTYKTFTYAQIIPFFRNYKLKDIQVKDVENFKKYMLKNNVSEHRIKNILCLLNQIIKYYQNLGFINKTCVFEVKRVAKIPKRQIQILTQEQLNRIFKIANQKYPYLTQIIQKVVTLKQPLNTILTGNEQEKKQMKCKIRKVFYKIKQQLSLENFKFDDLRFCQNENNL